MNKTLKTFAYDLTVGRDREKAIAKLRQLELKLPSARARFAIPFFFKSTGHFKTIEPRQNPAEVEALFAAVCELRPRRVLEIGTARGGALYWWCQAASDDAIIVSVDPPGAPDGSLGAGYSPHRADFYRAFTRAKQTMHLLRLDTHAPASIRAIADHFAGGGIDFAYIDRDHTYDGVRADFLHYGPLVRPGGLIAFHDILPRADLPSMQVFRLWKEVKKQFADTTQFIGPDGSGRKIGIGLLRVPDAGFANHADAVS